MTYEDKLKILGWTKAQLLEKLGKKKNAPSRWKPDAPKYVHVVLDQALEMKALAERVEGWR